MGNQLKLLATKCTNCMLLVRAPSSTTSITHHQVHQLVNLSKNPSSDVSQQIDHNKLSFALDQADQSYELAKEAKSNSEGETSMTVTQSSAKHVEQILKEDFQTSPPSKKEASPPLKQQLQQQCNTEESPMLQEEGKIDTFSGRSEPLSAKERGQIPILETGDILELNKVGIEALELFNLVMQDKEGFEVIQEWDDKSQCEIRTKTYTNYEKSQITQLMYKCILQTSIENYRQFSQDPEQQKKVESAYEAYDILEKDENCMLVSLKHKKVLFVDPKEYLYVKYIEQLDSKSYTEVSRSVNIVNLTSPSSQSTTGKSKLLQRGIIHLAGLRAKQISKDWIEIQGFIELNLKIKLTANMTKKPLLNEAKQQIDRIQKYFIEQKKQNEQSTDN